MIDDKVEENLMQLFRLCVNTGRVSLRNRICQRTQKYSKI